MQSIFSDKRALNTNVLFSDSCDYHKITFEFYYRALASDNCLCTAIFSRTYGNDCADYTTGCGVVGNLRACIAGLMCSTCPEDAGTCSNQCLIDKS